MTGKQIEEANSRIQTTSIKGKEYAPVSERVRAFRSIFPNYRIKTRIVSFDAGEWVIEAEILDESGDLLANGHASEKVGVGNINKTSALENAETSAVGRALGFLGIGIAASIASADEVTNAAYQLEEIKMREALATESEKKRLREYCDQLGADPMQIAKQAGWTGGAMTAEQHGNAMNILKDIEEAQEWLK